VFRKKKRHWRKVLGAFAGLAAIFGPYGFWYEPSSLRAVEHRIALPAANAIPDDPLRIAVISDLHGGAPYIGESKIDAVVALTNDAKPDLILLTGDYVTKGVLGGWHMPIQTIVAHLKALHAPLGVYAVLGNHDQREDPVGIAKAFEDVGIPVLDDRNTMLKGDGQPITLAGISDFRTAAHNVDAALSGIPKDAHAICFTHSPDVFPVLPGTCALTIAAHTHGGQVWLPLLGRIIVPSHYGQRYAVGLVHEDGKYLFVSTGIGTSILPVRFMVPPEVSILDIESGR
jgi:predicted MPP superfamily phosphohydrolase